MEHKPIVCPHCGKHLLTLTEEAQRFVSVKCPKCGGRSEIDLSKAGKKAGD